MSTVGGHLPRGELTTRASAGLPAGPSRTPRRAPPFLSPASVIPFPFYLRGTLAPVCSACAGVNNLLPESVYLWFISPCGGCISGGGPRPPDGAGPRTH